MPIKTKLIIWLLSVTAIAALLCFITIQGLMQVELTKTELRLNFMRLLEHEQVTDKVPDTLYSALMADYCGYRLDSQHWLFRYTQADSISDSMRQIEAMLKGPLLSSHLRMQWQCPVGDSLPAAKAAVSPP